MIKRNIQMRNSKLVRVVALACIFVFPQISASQAAKQEIIHARLLLDKPKIYEGQSFTVKIEIENISDHVVLVGRRITQISNWPFRIEIRLEDASGKQLSPSEAGFVDSPSSADLAIGDGILKWWMPLEPHFFMGRYVTTKFGSVPPGKYRLYARYVSIWSRTPKGSTAGTEIPQTTIPVFDGSAETNSISLEITSRDN